MTEQDAHQILSKNCLVDVGKFYGAAGSLSLGVGLLYSAVRMPTYDVDERIFLTMEKEAYVLTHECDVDQTNSRSFNDHVVVCPVIPIGDFITEYSENHGEQSRLEGFLAAVARREVNRVIYMPPGPQCLSHGGLLYLNDLASTHISSFDGLTPFAALSVYGLREFDNALSNHLLRPKSQPLSFQTQN